MPENRLVNYLDGGQWSATQFNTDFDRTVMMAQTNTMFERVIAPHYNTNDAINQNTGPLSAGVDTYLPVLPPNAVWMKNNANTAIVAVTGLGPGGSVTVPSTTNSFAYFSNTTGNVASSPYLIPTAVPTIPNAALFTFANGQTYWSTPTYFLSGSLTNAQILAMYGSPITLLSAIVPAGYAYIVKTIYLQIVFNTAAFANGGAIVPQYGHTIHGGGQPFINNGAANTIAAGFFTGAIATQYDVLFSNTNYGPLASAGYVNADLCLSNDTAAFTNAAGGLSTANWAVEVIVVPMS